jgi:hypothetical protein
LIENCELLEYIVDAYNTSAYNYLDFQPPLTRFSSKYTDYGTDTNGDGLYDYLTIDVGVNVTSAGNYSISGELYDATGCKISWSFYDTDLYVGNQTVKINFDGTVMQKHGVDGPYYLKTLTLLGDNYELLDYIVDAYATTAYNYADFQTPPTQFTDNYFDYGTDIDVFIRCYWK